MNNSGNTISVAPSALACARAARALAALPAISPTMGLSWASVTVKRVNSVMESSKPTGPPFAIAGLEDAYAFTERIQPGHTGDHQRDADGRRAHILHTPDLRIVFGGEPVGKLLDSGVEEFDGEQQQNHRHQLEPACCGRANQERQRDG